MSNYLDLHSNPLHKDDAVRIAGVDGELEGVEGVVHSFYLLRDGRHRARVHLRGPGGRAVGVRVDKLIKVHLEGPEPVFDALGPQAAELAALLGRRVVPPSEAREVSAAGACGEAIEGACEALLRALDVLDAASRAWPPPIESTQAGVLTAAARSLKRSRSALAAAPPSAKELVRGGAVGSDAAKSLVAPLKLLAAALDEAAAHCIDAFGHYLPVEHNYLDGDDAGACHHSLPRPSTDHA